MNASSATVVDQERLRGNQAARVLVLGSYAYPDSFEWHIVDSLQHLGCAVELVHTRKHVAGAFGYLEKALDKTTNLVSREPERLAENRLLRAVAAFDPQLILVVLGNQLSPKTIREIRKRSAARIVCWCQDHLGTLGRQFILASDYDVVFLKDRYMIDLFSRMIPATKFHYLAEACNPRMHRPVAVSPADSQRYRCDLMIAGTLHYYRQEILREILRRRGDVDLRIWGSRPDWLLDKLPGRHMGRLVHGDEKVRAVLSAKICLNTLHYAEINSLNCRAFELAGCGGFQLVTNVPVLKEHFEPDVEVAVYSDIDELLAKLDYYLRNPEAAAEIAARGCARAHREHTYEHRLSELLRVALGSAEQVISM